MEQIVDLRSDTVTRPSDAMRAAIVAAEVGDDVFGDDPTTALLERKVAALLGKQSALFMPSGVMSNQTAIVVHTRPGDEIICEANAHIPNNESGSPAALSGVTVKLLEGVGGVLHADQIKARVHLGQNVHQPITRLICLENTHNKAGGRVYPLDAMQNVAHTAHELGIAVHLDGARLFNAQIASGIDAAQYAACADTVNICLSKGLGCPIGSVLAGSSELIEHARRVRKRLGGGMRQVGIIAAAGLYALENNVDRLALDHANARRLAEGLATLPQIQIRLSQVETNIVLIRLDDCLHGVIELVEILGTYGVLTVPFGPDTIRAVTHLNVSAEQIDRAIEIFGKVLAG
ncbi:MAG: GntG family PLP-dependent aldolase [Candidatus Alcyoniella australis]|nr:GntG family PLP-dependent aldolase [Candidatus Alcyoniella australis]